MDAICSFYEEKGTYGSVYCGDSVACLYLVIATETLCVLGKGSGSLKFKTTRFLGLIIIIFSLILYFIILV